MFLIPAIVPLGFFFFFITWYILFLRMDDALLWTLTGLDFKNLELDLTFDPFSIGLGDESGVDSEEIWSSSSSSSHIQFIIFISFSSCSKLKKTEKKFREIKNKLRNVYLTKNSVKSKNQNTNRNYHKIGFKNIIAAKIPWNKKIPSKTKKKNCG